jgi:hypothetical protein
MDFSLLKMILIDSYAPGGEAIINLDGGAVVTGDNGAGKNIPDSPYTNLLW